MKSYKRILLKLSGESLAGEGKYGLNEKQLEKYARQLKKIHDTGIQIGVVIGGGNIFRGLKGQNVVFDRVKGDYMGMMATIINGVALQSALEAVNCKCKLFTAFKIEAFGEKFNKDKAIKALENGEIGIFTGGTGNPFFTTDSAAALRGVEINADILIKGTRVDGIYCSDPEKNVNAKKFSEITFNEVIEKNLKIMDLTAFTLCKENQLPIYVFDMDTVGNLERLLLKKEHIGTFVS